MKNFLFKRGTLFTFAFMLSTAMFVNPYEARSLECDESVAISAGRENTVGLKEDGSVVAVGSNGHGQLNVSGWTGIKEISTEHYHTVGLKEDGTVVSVGDNYYGQGNVSSWTGIKAISAGKQHTVGLKEDGTVVSVGNNGHGQGNISSWTGIKAISAGMYHTVGLREDGTVVADGYNPYGATNVSGWTGIKAIAAGSYHTAALKENGTVVAVGWNSVGQLNVSGWTDIKAIISGQYHTVGLKEDGTVVAVGYSEQGQTNVLAWTDIKAVAAGWKHTIGLKEDGTVVAVGYNINGAMNVSGWAGIGGPGCDTDGDEYNDNIDNCPLVPNGVDDPNPQADRDNDGIGDACDGDFDGDGVSDVQDNCPVVANEFQDDFDGDDIGDDCDACFDDATNACLNSPPQTISEETTYPVTLFNGAATASVTVEPGSLQGDTTIQIEGETGTSNFAYGSSQQVLGAVYTFTATPSSTFNPPGVTITLSYEQGRMPEGGMTEQRLDIFWYNTGTQQWEAQPILERNMVDNTLSIQTIHFSSYAVIATENPVGDLLDVLKDVVAENQGINSSFVEKVQYAYDLYETGDSTGARNNLKAFTNQIKALSGKKIEPADADMLIEFAEEIQAKL